MVTERINPQGIYLPANNRYTQIVKAKGGTMVFVSGMVSMDSERNIIGKGDVKTQTRVTLEIIDQALEEAGANRADIASMNLYVLDMQDFLENGIMETANFFGDKKPISTLVGVTSLAHPDYLVEIQVTAVID